VSFGTTRSAPQERSEGFFHINQRLSAPFFSFPISFALFLPRPLSHTCTWITHSYIALPPSSACSCSLPLMLHTSSRFFQYRISFGCLPLPGHVMWLVFSRSRLFHRLMVLRESKQDKCIEGPCTGIHAGSCISLCQKGREERYRCWEEGGHL
jgi:hypothetical protein